MKYDAKGWTFVVFVFASLMPLSARAPDYLSPTLEAMRKQQELNFHRLLLFGGPSHKTFLGCLNCPESTSDSVENKDGQFGSDVQASSIFNEVGQYGSASSQWSACNPNASDPPVIVDVAGKFYGRLTVNTTRSDAVRDQNVAGWLQSVVCKDR